MIAKSWKWSCLIKKGWSICGKDVKDVTTTCWEVDDLLTSKITKYVYKLLTDGSWVVMSLN